MSGHHVPLRPMDHDDDDEEDRSRHHRRTPYGFIFVALFLLCLLAAAIAGWALGMIYHVRGGLSQLALGSGGGDVGGTIDVPLLRTINEVPGTFPNGSGCTLQLEALDDGRVRVTNPCLVLEAGAVGGDVAGPLTNLTLLGTGWPDGPVCPDDGPYVVAQINTVRSMVASVECQHILNTTLNGTMACGDLTGMYPCATLVEVFAAPGCYNEIAYVNCIDEAGRTYSKTPTNSTPVMVGDNVTSSDGSIQGTYGVNL